MLSEITKNSLINFSKFIKTSLIEKYNISLKKNKCDDLVAFTLYQKRWSQLFSELPRPFILSDDMAARMNSWLYIHHKPLTLSKCKSLLENTFDQIEYKDMSDEDWKDFAKLPNQSSLPSDWSYIDDLNELRKKVAPLYNGLDENGYTPSSIIIVDPENKVVDTQSYINRGNIKQVTGMLYEFQIPSDIKGSELVKLLHSSELDTLIEHIDKDWDGETIKDDTRQQLHDFQEWLDVYDPEKGLVAYAEDYYGDYLDAYDNEDNLLGSLDYEAANKFVISKKHTITSDCDISNTIKLVKDDIDSNYEVRDIDAYLNNYYQIVCENSKVLA